jgi:hypothetical protein
MSTITNTHRNALAIPGGTVLQPGRPTPVHDWDKIKDNHVVKAWLKAGILKAGDDPAGDQGSQYVQPDKAELQAKLDALGMQYDKRSGVAKLQALLAEAEAAASEQAAAAEHAAKVEETAREDGKYTAEEFAALPDEERSTLLQAAEAKLAEAQA